MPANIPSKRERNQHKNLISPFVVKLAHSGKTPSSEGATVAIALVVALAVIAGTAIVAQRSFDGLVGSVFQGRAKDARLTAEAGTAFIISEWNRPANRRLYTGLPMGSWESAKNRCTAPSPTYEVANASNPTLQATSFKNGEEVSLPSSSNDTTRSFKLIRATFTPGSAAGRGTPLIVTGNPVSATAPGPAISEANPRGFLELVVEGRIYKAGMANAVATSIVTREFIVEPKCCNRSFGGIIQNATDLGNDFRACAGNSDLPIGDLAILTGIGGGSGLESNADNGSSRIIDSTGNKLGSITCTRPNGAASNTCSERTATQDLRTALGTIDYVIKPITIPSPPSISDARLQFCNGVIAGCTTLSGGGLNITNGATINSDNANTTNCHRGQFPPGSAEAYHCIVADIDLSGNGKTLTVDTTSRPVYLYLQRDNQDIDLGGNASIIHRRSGVNAPISDTNRLQIRGIPKPLNSTCNDEQDFDMRGNSGTAMFIWAPCAETEFRGTSTFAGIIWTNDLDFDGGVNLTLAIPSNPGTCLPGSTIIPCKVLEDVGLLPQGSAPIDWAARSINFTRFF
jgi:hypothetical protein